MTATALSGVSPWYPVGLSTQLVPGATVPAQASSQVGLGQLATLDASGNCALNDGTVPGLIAAGVGQDKISDSNSTAAVAKARMWWGLGGMPFSTGAGDGFTAADIGGVPAFIASENTIGRKSNVSGNSRSIAGMVYGLNDDGLALFWGGPMAQAHARAMLLLNSYPLASFSIADAAASTATAERTIKRPKVKGTVTSIVFNGAAVAASNTDYFSATVYKRDSAGGTQVSLGTYDSRAANQGAVTAFVDAAFSLSVVAGALFLLETDIVTLAITKTGAGQTLTGEFLVNGKAI